MNTAAAADAGGDICITAMISKRQRASRCSHRMTSVLRCRPTLCCCRQTSDARCTPT